MQIEAHRSQIVLVDMQQRLLPHIHEHAAVLQQCQRTLQSGAELGIPAVAMEQYKHGLGDTAPALREAAARATWFEKTTFSGCRDPQIRNHLTQQNRPQVILVGIEAHVCVLKTALDLLGEGLQPVVVADAVGSRRPYDREIALQRMQHAGVIVTTTESLIFEWLEDCRSAEFKRILPLVKA